MLPSVYFGYLSGRHPVNFWWTHERLGQREDLLLQEYEHLISEGMDGVASRDESAAQ